MTRTLIALPAALLMISACGDGPAPPPADPQDAFWAALGSHCGKAYRGSMVSDEEADAAMRGAEMVMHVRECSEDQIKVPFHIKPAGGEWDRSRTWVLTRTAEGLQLKHDHRHEDGSEDAVTMYGGHTASEGTADAQDFPVDAESVDLFRREGLDQSVTNVWRVEVDPADNEEAHFAYELSREGEHARFFRVSFDLTQDIPPPPAPWGH